MSEQGDVELFAGPAPSEKDEMSDEQFRDEMKRAQQQLKQLQQEEGQSKAQDFNLAEIIIQFLGQAGNTDLFLLISRAVAQNIPSELLLAIISLIDEKASKEVQGYLKSAQLSELTALTVKESADFKSLPPEHKKVIDNWIKNIYEVGSKKPYRILETVVSSRRPEGLETGNTVREISPVLVQLSTFILRNYLTGHKIEHEFDRLYEFMQSIFVGFVKTIEEQITDQKKLED